MSYSYLFMRLPDVPPRIKDFDPVKLVMPLESVEIIQERISSIFPEIEWSTFEEAIFGSVPPKCRAEFTLSISRVNSVDQAFTYHGPEEWISMICKAMNIFCWDPQRWEIWTPEGERKALRS